MAWTVMYDVMQWVDANGDPASGYVIKAYLPGTTTATSISIDKNGGSPQATITLNAEGKPEVSGNEVMLFIDRDYKWAVFENASDAASNSNPYAGFYDNVPQLNSSSTIEYDANASIKQKLDNLDVDDYAELRALTSSQLSDGDSIRVTDAGVAGLFAVRTGSVTDNGATLMVFTDDSNRYAERTDIEELQLSWWGVTDGVNGDTEIQSCIDYARTNSLPIKWVDGFPIVTTQLNIYNGTRIYFPVNGGLLRWSQGSTQMQPRAGIDFQPTTPTDLFLVQSNPDESDFGFRFNISIKGLWLKGDGTTDSRRALNLNAAADSYFNVGMEGFDTGILCNLTINNLFEQCVIQDCLSECVEYTGVATTDTWLSCRLAQTPTGVLATSCVAIRFISSLFEQITTYGADISQDCQFLMFDNCYCEDVPFGASPSASSAMFRVGHVGTTAPTSVSLVVTGGNYSGRNAGNVGFLCSTDTINSVIFSGVSANRWVELFRTTANTPDNSIVVNGMGGISWTLTNDTDKLQGITPSQAMSSTSGNAHNAYLNVVYSNNIRARSGSSISINPDVSTAGIQIDGSTTATETRLQVYDVDNGAYQRVTVGAADSGGAGFKVLRIPN